jgi:hypothetical protein
MEDVNKLPIKLWLIAENHKFVIQERGLFILCSGLQPIYPSNIGKF